MEEKIEKKLINLAKKGDLEAFEKIILDYEKKIYNICLRITHQEEESYDLAQEVCMKLWKQLHTFEGNAKLNTWIYRVTTNHCLDYLRKDKTKKTKETSLYQQDNGTDGEWMLDIPSEEKGVEAQLEEKELQQIVKYGMEELKEEYRVMVVIRDMEGRSYEEIASILDISLGTVKSRLSRARMALKKILCQNKEPYQSFFRQMKERGKSNEM